MTALKVSPPEVMAAMDPAETGLAVTMIEC